MRGNSFSKKLKGIYPAIGTIVIVVMLAMIGFWESYGRQKLLYKEVVVFKENVNRGDVVSDNMLVTVNRPSSDVFKAAITNKEQILNKGVNHFIPAGATLHPSLFDDPKLIGDKNSVVFKVPNEWILSVPDTIRRGDKAIIYEVDAETVKSITGINKAQKQDELSTTQGEQVDGNLKAQLGKELLKTVVAYVKDSNNKEVINASNKDRYDGSAKLSSLEILCKDENEFKMLEQSVKNGNKLIILYSEGGDK